MVGYGGSERRGCQVGTADGRQLGERWYTVAAKGAWVQVGVCANPSVEVSKDDGAMAVRDGGEDLVEGGVEGVLDSGGGGVGGGVCDNNSGLHCAMPKGLHHETISSEDRVTNAALSEAGAQE